MIYIVFAIWAAGCPRIHIPVCVNTFIRNVGHIFWHGWTPLLDRTDWKLYENTLNDISDIYVMYLWIFVLQIYCAATLRTSRIPDLHIVYLSAILYVS